MKSLKYFLPAILTAATLTASAQQLDSLRARVKYSFTHIEDTLNKEKPYKENMVLLLGRNASNYTSMDRINRSIETMKSIKEQVKNAVPGGQTSFRVGGPPVRLSQTDLFQFTNEKKLVVKTKLVNDYLVEEAMPIQDWKISNETIDIVGFKCQKATAKFKGRNYTAWFCPDLPFQNGPWKLNGLPGLILEAYDTKKEVEFKFDGFEMVKYTAPEKEAETILPGVGQIVSFGGDSPDVLNGPFVELPKKAIKTTQKDLDKLKDAMRKDPSGFINSALAGQSINVKINQTGPAPAKVVAAVNNPLELPEK